MLLQIFLNVYDSLQVGPRKKFRADLASTVGDDLSSDLSDHIAERSDCINRFSELYGRMPLVASEFRADPLLYKEKMPTGLQKYPDIGTL